MMRKKVFILMTATLMLTGYQSFAQKKAADPVLFTYGGKPVNKSEFLRMYTKNINNQKPDFSEKALKEYLTLYSRFKMKVSEAESLRMDTLPGIQAELGGYKNNWRKLISPTKK
ncbi:MAG: hypothetical protein IPN26_04090 [Bacteroidetes bacterium]|nr:hypothetical protein [Bacteroidota bacterium]